jgi:hypothetical protein
MSEVYTEWSKSHATHITYLLMVAIQYNSIELLTHNIGVTIQEPTQVTSCCITCSRQSVSCLSTVEVEQSSSQVQRVFIAEHYLASRSYFICQNKFTHAFPDSPVPNKSTISRLVNRFLHCRNSSGGKEWVNACITERGGHFQYSI